MLRIHKRILEDMLAHAREELPIEACGYLAGNDGVVTARYEMKNIDNSSEHFSFDVQEQFSVMKDARSKGLVLLAVYHSHPATRARPSEEDIKLAVDPGVSYVIASLAGNKEEVKSYKIRDGIVEHEHMEVLNNDKL